jgi:hypothetical protein
MFDRIPEEMRSYAQWVVWRYEDRDAKKPTKVPYSAHTHRHASVDDPSTWASYDRAVATAASGYDGIGFVLTNSDPFGFIDLDDPKGNDEIYQRQRRIFQEFDSYAELSPSGNGLHIIVRGKVESGRKRSAVEVYSNLRFMTMTGNVFRDAPIRDYDQLLKVLWSQMGGGAVAAAYYAGVSEAKETDEEVFNRAANAVNGQKFIDLHEGRWQQYYSSQSEADLSYINIVAFYTHNRPQIARMFRSSALGQRDKAKRPDYVGWMLNKSFDNILPPVDIEGLRNDIQAAIEQKKSEKAIEVSATDAIADPSHFDTISADSPYTVPPGLVGQIAQFIYAQAPQPVAEIALAGAIGLTAGIVGRSYNISSMGLNQYVLLLAPTGTGKEAIASGIDKIMKEVVRGVPAATEFLGPAEISSSQAMAKYMSKTATSFVSLVGEFGLYLQQLSSPNANPVQLNLRRTLLDLYHKSGEGKVLRPTVYSDAQKNTTSVLSPAFTMIGESTPERFYGALNEGMITEGLLPRFTTIEYRGDLTEFNENHGQVKPSFQLIEHLQTLCGHSLMLNSQHKAINVRETQDAADTLRRYKAYCNAQIVGSKEIKRQLWNRAHVKVLRLAAIVAVGCNPYEPTITAEIAAWAINIVTADVRNLLSKFEAGEIGIDNDENTQISTLVKSCRDYVLAPWSEVQTFIPSMGHLHQEKVIPYSYLQRKLANVAIFRKDRRGSSDALKRTIRTLVERGDLEEIGKVDADKRFKTKALCYMISNPKAFGL